MNIGEKLKQIRKEKGFTQKYVADKMGVSQPSYAQYENGKRKPKIEQLYKISNALSVDISVFSDSLYEIPEFNEEVYGSSIKLLILLIEEGPCVLPKNKANHILKKLKDTLKESSKIDNTEGLEDFYWNAEVQLSNEFLKAILGEYSDNSVVDLIELLSLYLSVSDTVQNKILEYASDLYEIPIYRKTDVK